jgi:Rieske Fe-S protein
VTQESLRQPAADTVDTASTARRSVLAGVGLAGVAALSACGTSSTPSGGAAPAGSSPGGLASGSGSGGGGGTALGSASEIPVRGGKIFATDKVVVTQPSAGQFKGFSAVCTHEGCIVDKVVSGTIRCPCHGSEYSITDGSVVAGPAPSPLPAKPVTVTGSEISLG